MWAEIFGLLGRVLSAERGAKGFVAVKTWVRTWEQSALAAFVAALALRDQPLCDRGPFLPLAC